MAAEKYSRFAGPRLYASRSLLIAPCSATLTPSIYETAEKTHGRKT